MSNTRVPEVNATVPGKIHENRELNIIFKAKPLNSISSFNFRKECFGIPEHFQHTVL